MAIVEIAWKIALLILIPLGIILLFYFARIVKSITKEKSIPFIPINQLKLEEKYKEKLIEMKKSSADEEIKFLADVILSLASGAEKTFPELIPARKAAQITESELKPSTVTEVKGLSKAQVAYQKAMQVKDPLKRKVLLQKVVAKYYNTEWADRALEEIIKIKEP